MTRIVYLTCLIIILKIAGCNGGGTVPGPGPGGGGGGSGPTMMIPPPPAEAACVPLGAGSFPLDSSCLVGAGRADHVCTDLIESNPAILTIGNPVIAVPENTTRRFIIRTFGESVGDSPLNQLTEDGRRIFVATIKVRAQCPQ